LNEGTVDGGGAEQDQPPDLVNLRDDGGLKYLKNNKAAGSDSIAAELLKNVGPNLVDALHKVIQLACIGETIPESWNKRVLCPVYKKAEKSIVQTTRNLPAPRGIQSLRQSTIQPFVTLRQRDRSALPSRVPVR
jgi:hypothetical protein